MTNFTTVECRISSWLKWYKNYNNRLTLAKVIVKNKMSRFLWFSVYMYQQHIRILGLQVRPMNDPSYWLDVLRKKEGVRCVMTLSTGSYFCTTGSKLLTLAWRISRLAVSDLSLPTSVTSCSSIYSPLLSSVIPQVFQSQLKTYLLHKFFPTQTLFLTQCWLRGLSRGPYLRSYIVFFSGDRF